MKRKGFLLTILGALVLMFGLALAAPTEAEAASSYQEIVLNENSPSKPVKVGKYYYKYKKGRLYYSKKKSSGYHKTKVDTYDGVWTNGKTFYYIGYTGSHDALYKYTKSSKKVKKLKTLPDVDGFWYGYRVGKVRGGKVFINQEKRGQYSVYSYKIKTKKFKREKKNCSIIANSGKYCVCLKEWQKKIFGNVPLNLYKVTSSGSFKKVKTITKTGSEGVYVIDGKFYYLNTPKIGGKSTLYRMSAGGKTKKKLVSFTCPNAVYLDKVTTKYCDIVDYEGEDYRYYY